MSFSRLRSGVWSCSELQEGNEALLAVKNEEVATSATKTALLSKMKACCLFVDGSFFPSIFHREKVFDP